MATIDVLLSPTTVSKLIEVNPTLTTDYGAYLNSLFTSIGTLQLNASSNFSSFLVGSTYGSYYFSSSTHAVVTTAYATYTIDGPSLLNQTSQVLQSHSGSVNITNMQVKFAGSSNVLTFAGSINLLDSGGVISSSGTLSNATWSFAPSSYQDVYGTSVSYTLNGSFGYSNGAIGAGSISSIQFASNGFAGTGQINGAVNVTPIGTGVAFSGTIQSNNGTYANGDYIHESNLNLPTDGVFSLNPLPSGNDTLTGTYAGAGLTIGTTSGCGATIWMRSRRQSG